VLDRCDLRPVARLVAFVIADHANRDGVAYPSVPTIARRAGVTDATVRRALLDLTAAGVFTVHPGGGRHRTNEYRFPVAAALSTSRAPARGYRPEKPARGTRETRAVDARNPRAGARRTEHEQNYEHPAHLAPFVAEGLTLRDWVAGQAAP
jgi:DNA-binding transcriptional MocR family regulator